MNIHYTKDAVKVKLIYFQRGSLCCVVANLLDCNIVVCKFELQSSYYVYLWTNSLGKSMNSFIPQQWINLCHNCHTRKDLILNNQQRVICY